MAPTNWSFQLTYWGVTGSFPRILTPHQIMTQAALLMRSLSRSGLAVDGLCAENDSADEFLQRVSPFVSANQQTLFGGNTTCLEIRTRESLFIIDAGSGLQACSSELRRQWNVSHYAGRREGHILMTHAHLDHSCALAYADVLHDPQNQFTVWATPAVIRQLKSLFGGSDSHGSLLVPIELSQLRGIREFRTIVPGDSISVDDVEISTLSLHHPGDCIAYRFDYGNRRIVVATDHEHLEVPDRALVQFAEAADLLYLDGQYLQCEYDGDQAVGDSPAQRRNRWGHSWIEASLSTAIAAGATRIHLGHHDPHRSDSDLLKLEQFARQYVQDLNLPRSNTGTTSLGPEVMFAREGDTWSI